MSSIAEKLNLLLSTKAAIKAAIEAKGVIVGNIPFSQYPEKIKAISGSEVLPSAYYLTVDGITKPGAGVFDNVSRSFDSSFHIEDIPYETNGTLKLGGDEVIGGWLSAEIIETESSTGKKSSGNIRVKVSVMALGTDLTRSGSISVYLAENNRIAFDIVVTQEKKSGLNPVG